MSSESIRPPTGEPFRAEVLSLDRLADKARALAERHKTAPAAGRGTHTPLLDGTEVAHAVLEGFNEEMSAAARGQRPISPAVEWLLDNYYLVEDQIREIRRDLPESYVSQLPRLTEPEWRGYPRIYEAAVLLISHTDSRLDRQSLTRFVMAYQDVVPLSIGEGWAMPTMLRVALVENLSRLARRVRVAYESETEADAWADRLLTIAQDQPDQVSEISGQLTDTCTIAPPSFHVRLTQRLAGFDVAGPALAGWLDTCLTAAGPSLEEVIHAEQQREVADQASIANAVTSVRFINALDWRVFFEEIDLPELVLRRDPAGVYPSMDFASRDRYRHALELLAQRCPFTEIEVAEKVVAVAEAALTEDPSDTVRGHVGYHLLSEGRYALERVLKYEPVRRELTHRGPLSKPGAVYYGTTFGLTVLLCALLGLYLMRAGTDLATTVFVIVLALVPLSDLVLNLVNRMAAVIWPPQLLPRLDFTAGVQDQHKTLVVMPVLVPSIRGGTQLIADLEVHYVSNADPNIHFGLLVDLDGGPAEHAPDDDDIIEALTRGIEELNARYGSRHGQPFHLLVRGRRFNPGEGIWMGWERKRGALEELNRLITGAAGANFVAQVGDRSFLAEVAFVLTLDQDTVLARDGAKKLICTIAHPLNRARYDREGRRVTHGYGVVQPRVSMSLASSRRSWLAWLYSGPAGIDPYAGAVSDTYQDVFGEGSYTGKAIYDVSIVSEVLQNRIPENQLLSHDLLEGCFAHTALASDIEVFDDYPASYSANTIRQQRWVRGDWQTLPWILPWVPQADRNPVPNPLSTLSRWKLFDNLRRSLFAPVMAFLLALGWLVLPGPAWAWSLILIAILLFPVYTHLIDSIVTNPQGVTLKSSVLTVWRDLVKDTLRALLTVAVLPHQAYVMVDAILRANWRQFVSHRHMLEWQTAAEAESSANLSLAGYMRSMWQAQVVAVALMAPTLVFAPEHRLFSGPLLILWLCAPLVAFLVSRPMQRSAAPATSEQERFMRRLARKTWRFSDRFVTENDHWLAPDNYQEDPDGAVAHRTSPTNIGLQILSYLAAHDLGYLTLEDLAWRMTRTLNSLMKMDRFSGHFYNWYDTRTLAALPPGYVSTVDSGNLAGYLVAVHRGLLEVSEAPLFEDQAVAGLEDTVRLALEELVAASDSENAQRGPGARRVLEEILRRITVEDTTTELGGWCRLLRFVEQALAASAGDPALSELTALVRGRAQEIRMLVGWCELLQDVPARLAEEPRFADLGPLFDYVPSLVGLAEGLAEALAALDELASSPQIGTEDERAQTARWCAQLAGGIRDARPACATLLARIRRAAARAERFWQEMDFGVLFDESRMVLSIGYNTSRGARDDSYYDMLASECRLASYVAIAKGDVPEEHWFRLARPLTTAVGGYALVSWSASMFEYLMPLLVMKGWPGTLLSQTYETVVRRQILYGLQRGVPWGVSESAFNARDSELTYQYQTFGVPGLGLKRGLSDDVVVAPYASMLALSVDRKAALDNLKVLSGQGAEGHLGFYEAVDYTPGRVPAGRERAIVRTYMAHHEGMSFVALAGELTGYRMQQRFSGDPMMRSAELLLQERVPRHVPIAHPHAEELAFVRSVRELPPPVNRTYDRADTYTPATHFLSNGRYSVMVTNAGGGYSRFEGLAVTRYREDVTRDCWGMFFFIRDRMRDRSFSATAQPLAAAPSDYGVLFAADKAEFLRRDDDIETHTEVMVSPEDDAEIRRITIANRGLTVVDLDVTSYFEASLTTQEADQSHRAFQNLFVETEAVEGMPAVLFTRRPRSSADERLWGFHTLACEATECGEVTHETDRARFLGRLRTVTDAQAVTDDAGLSNTTGAVLDPVVSIRQPLKIRPGESAHLSFTTGVAPSRAQAIELAEKYQDPRSGQRAAELAWTASQIELRDLGITPDQAILFERLASRLLLTDPYSRLKVKTPVENGLPLSGLWALGISGDLPILLVEIERAEEAPLVRQLLLAHQYWRHKGLISDLVILNTRPSAYADELEERLKFLVRTGQALELADKPGGVFIRRADLMHADVLALLETCARAVLVGDKGSLAVQLDLITQHPEPPAAFVPTREVHAHLHHSFHRPRLVFDNEYGGFDPKSHEYVVVLPERRAAPAPWINVLANPDFGGLVSEAGVGCTWALNSALNRLTTWNNDPVSDGSGEVIYLRDEETGEYWSPTPLPIRQPEPYVVRHGRGYTRFWHESHGLEQEVDWFVPVSDPVRIVRLSLTNHGDRPRTVSATHFIEWSLGASRSAAQQRVVTWYDAETSMLTAHNHFNADFPGRCAFLAADAELHSYTASRTEFLGRNGHPARPAAMSRVGLGGETGRFFDNCGALMTVLAIEPGATAHVTFLLGQTDTLEQARDLVARYRKHDVVDRALAAVRRQWDRLLDAVEVTTPNKALDLMMNGPLQYQALACRIWGRTATYQSSGAFGFRDQLQDTLAFALTRPEIMRDQIIEAARHQFAQGDVLHWWMPGSGTGVRTRISDDRHWLAYVAAAYVEATGDASVLDVEVPFIDAAPLEPGQDDAYITPAVTERLASIYEHCVAALESARPVGPHGLPLMGGGDWNDGMNRVGHEGRGESVWLAWFLIVVLTRFAPLAGARGDEHRARSWRAWAAELASAIEEHAWDGSWYRRAFFDDGTPLGTRKAEECQIDAIAQAWAVISGAGDRGRATRAMDSVEEHLVRWEDRLILLLEPPFDKMSHDPGYIKGYLPGARENGGQYTHGVLWVVLAHLLAGDGDEAHDLLDLLNPVKHTSTRVEADAYAVEPYAVAADVYAVPQHAGRGGWTWYTGSAAWFYQIALNHMLGLQPRADANGRYLFVDPCIPKSWHGFSVKVRWGSSSYEIEVANPRGVNRGVERVVIDGKDAPGQMIRLIDDGKKHHVTVSLLGA